MNEINNTNDINEYLDNVISTLCKEKTIANINFSLTQDKFLINTNAINDKDILVSHALLSIYILNKFGVSYEDFVEMLKKVKTVLKG